MIEGKGEMREGVNGRAREGERKREEKKDNIALI